MKKTKKQRLIELEIAADSASYELRNLLQRLIELSTTAELMNIKLQELTKLQIEAAERNALKAAEREAQITALKQELKQIKQCSTTNNETDEDKVKKDAESAFRQMFIAAGLGDIDD